nr:MAG TPA: hypothetical protein [Caudoviricetes sp.]
MNRNNKEKEPWEQQLLGLNGRSISRILRPHYTKMQEENQCLKTK